MPSDNGHSCLMLAGGLSLDDEDEAPEDDDEANNPYHNPYHDEDEAEVRIGIGISCYTCET